MFILFKYLFKEVFVSSLAVSLVLLLIVMSGRLAKYLSDASAGRLSSEVVFTIIFYRIPDFLPLILPLGLFVGILLTYGRLYVESEMTVMRACGLGKLQLLNITMIPTLAISLLVAWLSLYAAPASLNKVQSLLNDPNNSEGFAVLQEGKFQSDKAGGVSYVEKIVDKQNIENIWLIKYGAENVLSIVKADHGRFLSLETDEGELEYFEVLNGAIYEGVIGQQDYRITTFDSFAQQLKKSHNPEKKQLEIDALPTLQLLNSSHVKEQAALHWRLSLPVIVLIVAFMAFGLSKTNHRQGRYVKLLPAILIYLIYIVMVTGVRDLVERQEAGVAAIWLVHALFFALALGILLFDDGRRFIARHKSSPKAAGA